MNCLTIRGCFLAWILLFPPCAFCGNVEIMEDKDPYQRARYHLEELQSSLEEIEQSHNGHKRSTHQENQDDIVNSLASICSKLYKKSPESSEQIYKDNDEDRMNQNKNSLLAATSSPNAATTTTNKMSSSTIWPMPSLLPIRVEAERIEGQDKVKITFDVMHSKSFFAVAFTWFDYINKSISQVNSNTEKLSKVEFLIDSTYCRLNPSQTGLAFFLFTPQDKYNNGMSFESVDICRFDKFWDKNWKEKENKLEWKLRDEKIISQDLKMTMPRFKLRSDIGDDVYIKRGEDPVFEIDANLCESCTFIVYLKAWDWESNTEYSNTLIVEHSDSEKRRLNIIGENSTKTFLKLDILREIAINDSVVKDIDGNDRPYAETLITARITVEISTRQISGELLLSYKWDQRDLGGRHVVNGISLERAIFLRLPYKITTFPRDYAVIFADDKMCNKMRMDNKKDCFAECHVWGMGLKDIFIVKTHPYRPPFESVSYVRGRSGYAANNIGPVAEADTEGTYKCVVLFKNGTVKSKTFHVYTTGFPKVTNTFVEEFANGSTKVECTGTGVHPLNMSVIAMDNDHHNEQRLDDKPENKVFLETVGDTTNLTLFLSTDQLKHPYYYVQCVDEGDRGIDWETIYIRTSLKVLFPIFRVQMPNKSK